MKKILLIAALFVACNSEDVCEENVPTSPNHCLDYAYCMANMKNMSKTDAQTCIDIHRPHMPQDTISKYGK